MTTVQDKWGLTSGLPLADADVEIVGFEFGYNQSIGAGLVCANISFRALDDDSGELVVQSFTTGDGWEIAGKGASIEGRKKINKQTNWGRLVESMIAACGGAEGIDTQLPDADYRVATSWIGTRWHLGTVQVETTNPSTQTKKMSDKIVATAFLGVGEVAPSAATTAGTSAGGKKAGKATLADSNPELFAELVAIAQTHDDHDKFMAAVLERADVESDAIAMNAVMSVKAGSIWAAK